ncbi:unnamed protein product [Heligmosomoides polygyrus]|uniref:ShKT domain-containing protein n=1 Tax=Heligmosomoides polygyrus TaxID=6339 RepID=A0A3P7ZRT4_HELPZ|nr:unnamed protein product [Heligmosomoides polygyrus]
MNGVCQSVKAQLIQISIIIVTVATDSSGNNITTVASTYVTSSVTTTCVDKVNPSTGVSDCAAQASLCNDATYYAVMTVQCPKTCGRCSSSTSYSSTCVDKINPSTGVSDCSALAYLCTNTAYTTLMTAQCPRTCNLCSYNSTATTVSSSCVDKLNPTTGVSDCAQRVSLCTDSNYTALMRVQCPRTCGFCSSTGSTVTVTGTATTTTACVDAINPSTGISDCSSRVALCTNSSYLTLMRTQCPKTCGFC